MRISPHLQRACAAGALVLSACSDVNEPGDSGSIAMSSADHPAPAGLVSVAVPGGASMFWPYTGVDFTGTGQDPINLVFVGQADALAVRAALMGLTGDRSAFGFPGVAPFNCTWSDAIGGSQTAYSDAGGWTGSAIQLQCGAYGPIRFHLRLFDAGAVTLGGVHFEMLIPGTADHQVLSWELAEQLVAADMMRSGLLASAQPLAPSAPIHAAPFRDIPAVLYNLLPAELKGIVGGPLGSVTSPVPIPTDGRATVVNIATAATVVPGVWEQDFELAFGQTVPKPFCSPGPAAFLQLGGPVRLRQRVQVLGNGRLIGSFHADGRLSIQPLDFSTGSPVPSGDAYEAEVKEVAQVSVDRSGSTVHHAQTQTELPLTGPYRGQFRTRLAVGVGARADFEREIRCGEQARQ